MTKQVMLISQIFFVFLLFSFDVHALVTVSDKFSEVYMDQNVDLASMQFQSWGIYNTTKSNDYYEFNVNSSNNKAKYVVLLYNETAKKIIYEKTIIGNWKHTLNNVDNNHIFIIKNISPSQVSFNALIYRKGSRTKEDTNQLRLLLNGYYSSQYLDYKFPPVNVMVEPCDTINAYSSDKITLCTELVNDLINKVINR